MLPNVSRLPLAIYAAALYSVNIPLKIETFQECRLGKCSDPCVGFTECGTNAVCTAVEHLPTCTCPAGYKELNSPYDACVEENVDLTQLECLTDSDCSAPSSCLRGVCRTK